MVSNGFHIRWYSTYNAYFSYRFCTNAFKSPCWLPVNSKISPSTQLPNTSYHKESLTTDIRLEASIKSEHTGKIYLITGHKVTMTIREIIAPGQIQYALQSIYNIYTSVVGFLKQHWPKVSARPGLDLRSSPWLLLSPIVQMGLIWALLSVRVSL